jgi:hypothetical protein
VCLDPVRPLRGEEKAKSPGVRWLSTALFSRFRFKCSAPDHIASSVYDLVFAFDPSVAKRPYRISADTSGVIVTGLQRHSLYRNPGNFPGSRTPSSTLITVESAPKGSVQNLDFEGKRAVVPMVPNPV